MKRKFAVAWSDSAEQDFIEIIKYIASESPSAAESIIHKIRQAASQLYSLPERGSVVPELKDQGIQLYRELIISPWRILYRISEKTVFVIAVLDSRRNIEDILLEKLISK